MLYFLKNKVFLKQSAALWGLLWCQGLGIYREYPCIVLKAVHLHTLPRCAFPCIQGVLLHLHFQGLCK